MYEMMTGKMARTGLQRSYRRWKGFFGKSLIWMKFSQKILKTKVSQTDHSIWLYDR